MIGTFRTLFIGANARAEEQVRDRYSIELIDQKIRESKAALKGAKLTLAGLIQRQRSEGRQVEAIKGRISDLTKRLKAALKDGREDLAAQGAQAVADLENELSVRQETTRRLEARIMQLRQSVEAANRRIVDLQQGAVSARAIRQEQGMQTRLNKTLNGGSAMEEAEELIAQVLNKDDPFEQGEILREIDAGLGHTDMADRFGDAGFGPKTRVSADDVLSRLKDK